MKFTDDTASHLPILEKAANLPGITVALEHGCGHYSTACLLEAGCHVWSLEDMDAQWLKTLGELPFPDHWHPVDCTQRPADGLLAELMPLGLVFADGSRFGRAPVGNEAFGLGVPLVLFHDTELGWFYEYERLRPQGDYVRYEWRCTEGRNKGTVLYARRDDHQGLVEAWGTLDYHRRME